MVKPGIPQDPDFIQQYGGGIHQYGTKGASPMSDQNAEEFQRQMQANETQINQVPKVSPQEMLNVKNTAQVGPPDVQPLQAPAPENFGPPKISSVQTDNQADFGAPGSQSFQNVSQNFGAPKEDLSAQTQKQMSDQLSQAQNQTQDSATPTTFGAPPPSNSGGNQLGATGSGGDGKGKKDSPTYHQVEKMEVNNMLENAMAHMKFKDPDPSAWG